MSLPLGNTKTRTKLPTVLKTCDPFLVQKVLWPDTYFYKEQRDVVESVWQNRFTYVPAAQKMGKDYVAGFVMLVYFLTRHPCRIVNTSANDDHLVVLWAELEDWIARSRFPLLAKEGGNLYTKHREMRKTVGGKVHKKSYVKGMVAADDRIAAMGGHHVADPGDGVPRTLFLPDECSSVRAEYMSVAEPWAHRILCIGNTWDCPQTHFWRAGIERGNVEYEDKTRPGLYSKVIHIPADRSPNVRYALAEIAAGRKPSGRMIVPGPKDWYAYQEGLAKYDDIERCVKLDARFYVGKELRLFPPEWLTHARRLAIKYRGKRRKALAVGVDPAEGGDKTSLCAVDQLGVVELLSLQTPDTNQIPGLVVNFGLRHGVDPGNWVFDRGGGGKQHADRLRDLGFHVRTVAFGESPTHHPRPETVQYDTRVEDMEQRGAYVNRRAEMYGRLSAAVDPGVRVGEDELGRAVFSKPGFAIPGEYDALFQQLGPIPKLYDGEGKLRLPPKHKKDAKSKEVTLTELIGHSPDEADSLVLAYYGMVEDPLVTEVGGAAV